MFGERMQIKSRVLHKGNYAQIGPGNYSGSVLVVKHLGGFSICESRHDVLHYCSSCDRAIRVLF